MHRYIVTFLMLILLVPSVVMAQDQISIGDSVTGNLSAAQSEVPYRLHLEEGQAVQIALASDDFDTYLRLYNAAEEEIARNDDGDYGTNSLLNFVSPETQTYLIHATSYNNSGSGDYTLSVRASHHEWVSYGDSATGFINVDETHHLYSFEGSAGDTLSIALNSDEFDTYLRLFDTSDYLLTSDDDTGPGRNALIGGYVLPEDGVYRIHASGFSSDASGDYTLSIGLASVTEVVIGNSVDLNLEDVQFIAFDAEAGQIIDLVVDIPDLSIELTDPNGYWVASSGYVYEAENTKIANVLITETGTYRAIITIQDAAPGPITFNLQETDLIFLEAGQSELIEFSPNVSEQILAIALNGEEQIRLTITPVDTDFNTFYGSDMLYLSISLGEEIYGNFDFGRNDEVSLTLSFDYAGSGLLRFMTYTFDGAAFQVTLERLGTE